MAEVTELEINRTWLSRIFEILPGLLAWLFILSPIVLSLLRPELLAYIIIAYALWWLTKAFGLSFRLIRGYRRLHVTTQAPWLNRLKDLHDIPKAISRVGASLKQSRNPSRVLQVRQYLRYLKNIKSSKVELMDPDSLYHVAIVAAYNEPLDILEPTIRAIMESDYPLKRIMVFIAYEERGGAEIEARAKYLIKTYGHHFAYAEAIKHPQDMEGEVVGKGGNITYTGRKVAKYIKQRNTDPKTVIVTTLDSDNRPHPQYFAYLSFIYCSQPNRIHRSYQPVPMYFNNIWDVPAPMRVIATGNSFWILMEMMRPNRLRNFSAHAQSLQTLLDTDFWSVRTIVEDGHQYWRTYFRYDGQHEVVPIYVPIYQDAVLARGYLRTFRAQFIQLRRWAWGASDIAYVAVNSVRNRRIKWSDKTIRFLRLCEGHFSWATAPLILAFAAWLPLLLNPGFSDQVLAHQLPRIASRIMMLAMVGIAVTILVSMVALPPRPAYYRRRRSILMVLQWVLLPVTTICFGSFAALNAQTRLMLGRYLDRFDVTEKATKK